MKKLLAPALLVCLVGALTLILQVWIGRPFIYSKPDQVRQIHEALLTATPPPGKTWTELGINSGTARRGALELAQLGHESTGIDVAHVYFAMDTLFLFISILLLWVWLRRWLPPPYALIGILYYAAVAPLTYLFFYFHPWDRLSACLWLVALLAMERRQLLLMLAAMAAGMYVKFDMILLPFLYATVTWKRAEWKAWALRVAAVFVVVWGIWQWLMWLYPIETPAGAPLDFMAMRLLQIVGDLRAFAATWPPLLFMALPLTLIALCWRRLPLFLRWSAAFVLGTLLFYALTVNFREVRAQVPMLCLLLPAALLSLRSILEPDSVQPTAGTPA